MADLSGLNLKNPSETNWDDYPPGGGERKPPHPAGTYTFVAPELKDIKFDTQDGNLRFVNKAQIQDALEGKADLVFDYVTNKPYARGKRQGASRMGDFLLAVGSDARPQSHQEYADAVEEAAGAVFEAVLDWDAYDPDLGKEVANGEGDFPDDPNRPGEKLPYVVVDRTTGARVPIDQEGSNTKRVAARQRIRFYTFKRD